jgi:hypothetical protein
MVATGFITMAAEGIWASSAFPAFTGCAICVMLWMAAWLGIQKFRTGATETRIRHDLRVYLDNCQQETAVRPDPAGGGTAPKTLADAVEPAPSVTALRRDSAQAGDPSTAPGFQECVPASEARDAGLVVFDAMPWRGGAGASRLDLALPGCGWQVMPGSPLPGMQVSATE